MAGMASDATRRADAIPTTVLIVAEPLLGLGAERVAATLRAGLSAGERRLSCEAIAVQEPPADVRKWWRAAVPAERLRAARALLIAAARLDERTLAASVAFEAATSARQAGVPTYAVTAENALDRFDARMLDLQVVLQAGSQRSLRAAGGKLAKVL
jgi:hypothetical protein